jgi:hypothetical protein
MLAMVVVEFSVMEEEGNPKNATHSSSFYKSLKRQGAFYKAPCLFRES